jgi:PncC family amidohydrolase
MIYVTRVKPWGLLRAARVPGVSDVFVGTIVSYANEVKEGVLGVSRNTLRTEGAVSAPCADEMVRGALRLLRTDFAVAITGIAGPSGGSDLKPVGTAFIAVGATNLATGAVETEIFHYAPRELKMQLGREEMQNRACAAAISHLRERVKGSG